MIPRRRLLYGTAFALVGRGIGGSVASCSRRPTPPADGGLCASTVTTAPRVRNPLRPNELARFVDRLPIPRILTPDGVRPDPDAGANSRGPAQDVAYYRVRMREGAVGVHRDLSPTRIWGYDGAFPGPTFETRSGKGLLVEWVNELPERHFLPIDRGLCGAAADQPEVRTVVHVHGARVRPESDGYPEDWFAPGHSALLHYPNAQEASTLWYHDHAMGIERLNQYAGLFGLYLIRDGAEDALRLPSGPYEVPLLFSDRLFDATGQLVYPASEDPMAPWIPELNGDAMLVNGKLFPYLDVEPRLYRFRLLNASNSRFYELELNRKQPIHQIGTDQGLLPATVPLPGLMLAPGERADVLIDFGESPGQDVVLHSQTFQLVQFRVGPRPAGPRARAPIPSALRPVIRTPASAATNTRFLTLNEYEAPKTLAVTMLLNGLRWRDPVTEKPAHGSVEIWELANLTEDSHPIHLHMVRFQILERQAFDADFYTTHKAVKFTGPPEPPAPQDAGWKDTVRADSGIITRIIVRFDGYAGRYAWHCHILEHAANEMMRPFEVVST
jgi:spore coat protein A